MSTTFDIFPSIHRLPTFREVLDRTTYEYHEFLKSIGVDLKPIILISILTKEGNKVVPHNESDAFSWGDDCYAWVQIKGIAGGTDGYFWEIDSSDKQYWEEDILPMDRCKLIKPKIEACLSQKYCWNFRRSAGQSGAINILYGILSGSIATITEGIVFSDDCAWDYDRMPIQGNEFLKTYYRPDLETNPEIKKEAIDSITQCIRELEELMDSFDK